MSGSFSSTFESLCAAAEQYTASDLLLHEGRVPQIRLDGRLVELEMPALDGEFFAGLWERCRAGQDVLDFDTSVTSDAGVRFRANLLRQLGSRGAVLRRIRRDIPTLESLGAPVELLKGWVARPSGIILVCGPTGCGKSTTLAAALDWMNSRFGRHVVTIEDPIEYLFTSRSCLFTQREVGVDTTSFAEGLRRSLRQNPDVIFVGEIRDGVTAGTAIQAAETGHLVLATLHSSSAADTIERLQLLFPADEREGVRKTLSAQLLGVLCQKLIPGRDKGVVLAAEYFNNTGVTRKYIADGELPELSDFLRRGDPSSASDFLTTTVRLVREGLITEQIAMEYSDNPHELQRALRGISTSGQSTRQ